MEPRSPPSAYAKQEFVGAVTLLHFSRDGSLLFVGVGATLYAYETATGLLAKRYDVFPRGILHGLDYVSRGDTQNWTVFFGQKRLQCVRDVPESTAAVFEHGEDLQRVGKAKVLSDWIFDVQILSEQTTATDPAQLVFPTIAVGLAHNFIQLWDPNADQLLRSVICSERCILYSLAFFGRRTEDLLVASGTVFQQVLLWGIDGESDRADPQQRLHGHDGVIFKLEWSSDARMLASVSDDRTVQLWTNAVGTDDAMDADPFNKSEWLARAWSSRFRAWGHTARLWDVRFCDAGVVTTSEDGMCRLWALDGACLATLQGHMGKHVWRVAVHPSNRLLATGGGDGAVKFWDLAQQIKSTSATAGADSEAVRLVANVEQLTTKTKKKTASLSIRDIVVMRSTTINGTRGFVAVEDGRIYELDVKAHGTTAHLAFSAVEKIEDGATPNVSSFALDEDEQVLLVGDANGSVLVVDVATLAVRTTWKAHASRIMKVWWDRSTHGTLFTCSTDGGVREWRIFDGSDHTPELVGDYIGPAKCATSALAVIDIDGTRNVVCGDARGNLFGFSRPVTVGESPSTAASPSFVMRGVHGRDMIATLLRHDRLVYSGGHDGYICSFLLDATDGLLTLRYLGRESIKGITTVKQLWLNEAHELMVFGFHATFAVLYNFTAQYRLFMVECGGWRRPHALLTGGSASSSSIPAHTFVFTPVTKTSDLLVQVHSSPAPSDGRLVAVSRASVHHQFHGRTTTCVRAIGADRLVTAGEDNALKLHKRLPVPTVAGGRAVHRWTCLSTGIAHTTTIRALDSFYVASQRTHILLSGGGKQRLNAWRVRDDLDVIEFLCGQEMSEADQDHRILGLTSFAVGASERFRIVVATNSEGSIQILLLDLGEDMSSPVSLHELGQCSSSKKPILSCDSVLIAGRALLAVGSTDGMINLWDLTDVLARVSSSPSESLNDSLVTSAIRQLQPMYNYLAHDMGTNCLCIAASTSSFRIISGGDDQNLRVRELSAATLELLHECHARNASGSALKAVAASRDGHFVYGAGYDQRVSQWTCDPQDAMLTWQCAAFTECADIASVDVIEEAADELHTVVAVGQGLQTVQFSTRQ